MPSWAFPRWHSSSFFEFDRKDVWKELDALGEAIFLGERCAHMWRYMGIIVLAVVLGYGSNAMSQTACLENAVFWYSHVMMSSQPYYVKLEPGQEHIPEVLEQVGAPYTLVTPASEKTAYPQVRIHTNAWIPFVISERFDAAADATKRVSFTAHYIAMFGMPLSMGDSFDIPTLLP